MQEINQLIQTVGFPIVAYLLIYLGTSKQIDALREQVNSLRETVSNNTKTMETLTEYIKELKEYEIKNNQG